MKGTVVVQVSWADPNRAGLRTLHVEGSSIDETWKAIARAFESGRQGRPERWALEPGPRAARPAEPPNGAKRRHREMPPPVPQPLEPEQPANGHSLNGEAMPDSASAENISPDGAPILWASHAPDGRFGPAATLLRVQLSDRKIMLRIPGLHHVEVGRPVRLDGVEPVGQFFSAEMTNGSEYPLALRLNERLA